jgi:BirA family biotin operon repressor/biotin-[acetyl-CoA-carboxylase] ligase
LTPNQTKGKGQRGNNWESATGLNLTTSFILYPTFLAVQQQFMLTQMVSLAVIDFATQYSIKSLKIKWPNDIYQGDQKLAGILIENSLKGNTINASIIGIGININQTGFSESTMNATSFKLITGKGFDIHECFRTLCNCLEARYLQLKASNPALLQTEYLQKLYRINELHDYRINGEIINGEITDVDTDGRLQLTTVENEQLLLDLKEVQFII